MPTHHQHRYRLEAQFAALEGGTVEDELLALKALKAGRATTTQAPGGRLLTEAIPGVVRHGHSSPVGDAIIDSELEVLRRRAPGR